MRRPEELIAELCRDGIEHKNEIWHSHGKPEGGFPRLSYGGSYIMVSSRRTSARLIFRTFRQARR